MKSGVDRRPASSARGRAAQRGAQAGEQLVHPERLGHVVVGAGVERRDLVGLAVAHRQHDDRHRAPAPQPADHVDAVDAREPEVEDHDVGVVARRELERLLAVGGEVDLVAAGAQVDRRARAGSAARRRRPGRGVTALGAASCGGRTSDHRGARRPGCPRRVDARRPSPRRSRGRPRGRARRRRRWTGRRAVGTAGTRVALGRRDARAAVDDPQVDASPTRRLDPHRGRRAATTRCAFSTTLATARSSSAGVGVDAGQRLGHVDLDAGRAGRRGRRSASGDDLVERRRRASRAASAPVCSRLMSSRLPTSVVEPVGLLVDRLEELVRRRRRSKSTSRCSRLVTDALIDASGVRRSCDTAAQQRGAQLVGSPRAGRRGRAVGPQLAAAASATGDLAANARSTVAVRRRRVRRRRSTSTASVRWQRDRRRRPPRAASAPARRADASRAVATPSASTRARRRASSANVARSWSTSCGQRVVLGRAACRSRPRERLGLGPRRGALRSCGAPRWSTSSADDRRRRRGRRPARGRSRPSRDRERVERRGEEPVGEQEADDRRDERGHEPADGGDDDHERGGRAAGRSGGRACRARAPARA